MFDLFMYVLTGAIGLVLALLMLATAMTPVYFWLRGRAD